MSHKGRGEINSVTVHLRSNKYLEIYFVILPVKEKEKNIFDFMFIEEYAE